MDVRSLGRLGPVSALSLGGGGVGSVFGPVDRAEAIATLRAAVDAGITLLDLAPTYGPDEAWPAAETLVGEAFDRRIPAAVRVTSKVALEDPTSPEEIRRVIRASLHGSLERLGRERLDVLFLHSAVRPSHLPQIAGALDATLAREVVVPELERLVQEGTIVGWGLTGVAHPDAICELIQATRPTAVQCVTNALDAVGDLWLPGMPPAPDNARIRATAVAAGASVMGIRAVAAGALAGVLDRTLAPEHPVARDAQRAAAFRALARERGESPSLLAHRYALSLPDVATVVLGAKNREELAECLAAEAAPALTDAELLEIEQACARGEARGATR